MTLLKLIQKKLKQDWGYIVAKTAYGFSTYIQGLVAQRLLSVVDGPTGTKSAAWGIAGYQVNGFNDQNWLTVSRNVSMANGGAQTYAFGTEIALANVLPNATTGAASNFRYDETSAIVNQGYLPSYKNIPLIKMDQALVPNTINGVPVSIVPDNKIFMLPAGMDKPVKVVFEGQSVSVSKNPQEMADHTYTFQIDMRLGVDIIVGAKFGAILL